MKRLHIGICDVGEYFYLPLELVTTSLAILAKKRVGKSYTAAVFAEELMKAGQPVCIIDITGAHWGLKSSANGKDEGYPVVIFGGRHADVPLEDNAGAVVARALVEQRFSAILDFSIMTKAAMQRFLIAFLGEFYRLNQDPIHLICDEADRYCPQQPNGDEMKLVQVMDDIVSRGGIKGIGVSIISQRSAKVNKNIVTQCELLVAMRIVHPLDAKTIMEWVEMHATKAEAAEMLKSLPTLPVGTAWFWWPRDDGSIFERVAVRPRETFDSGRTPKAGEVRKQPKTLAQIDVAKLGADIAATIERAKAEDPKELRAKIVRLEWELKEKDRHPLKMVVAPPEPERIEVPLLTKDGRAMLEKLLATLIKHEELLGAFQLQIKPILEEAEKRQRLANMTVHLAKPQPKMTINVKEFMRAERAEGLHAEGSASLSRKGGPYRMMVALAQRPGLNRSQLGLRARVAPNGGSFDSYLSKLRTSGYLENNGNSFRLTSLGIQTLGEYEALSTGRDLLRYYLNELGNGGASRMLAELAKVYPGDLDRDELGHLAHVAPQGGSFDSYLSRLRTLELIKNTAGRRVIASAELFD